MSFEIADKLFEEDQYKKALEIFSELRLTSTEPKNQFKATIGVGGCLYSLGELFESKKILEGLLEDSHGDKDEIDIYFLYKVLGDIFSDLGRKEKALEMYQEASNFTSNSENVEYRARILNAIGVTYLELEKKEMGFNNLKESLKLYKEIGDDSGISMASLNLGKTYAENEDYKNGLIFTKEALRISRKDNDEIGEALALGNLGDILIDQKKYNKAFVNIQEHFDILKRSKEEEARNHIPESYMLLARGYYYEKEYIHAEESALEALEFHKVSSNSSDIDESLNFLSEVNLDKALEAALASPFGRNWLLEKLKKLILTKEIISADIWRSTRQAVLLWWNDVHSLDQKIEGGGTDNLDGKQSQYDSNWKIKHKTNSTQESVTDETTLNLLLGVNNISIDNSSQKSMLRDEQRNLRPMWFVEIPYKLFHDDRYLKIRVNNLVEWGRGLQGYPLRKPDMKSSPIDRIKIQFGTQWLQRFEIDHKFYPNTQEEYDLSKKSKEDTWLSDVFIFDLNDKLKAEDWLDLSYTIQVFFKENDSEPAVKTTTHNFPIPVIRKNRYQVLEKIRKKNENFLALVIASTSIIGSITSLTLSYFPNDLLNVITSNFAEFLFFSILGVSLILGFLSLLLKRQINSDLINENIEYDIDSV